MELKNEFIDELAKGILPVLYHHLEFENNESI